MEQDFRKNEVMAKMLQKRQLREDHICVDFVMLQMQFEIDNLLENKDYKILDIGAGDGKLVLHLKQQGFTNVEGVDAFPRHECVKQARIEELPYTDNSLDVITSHSVFDPSIYNVDVIACMKEIYRCLKKGGVWFAIEGFVMAQTYDETKLKAYMDFMHTHFDFSEGKVTENHISGAFTKK